MRDSLRGIDPIGSPVCQGKLLNAFISVGRRTIALEDEGMILDCMLMNGFGN
jgi:hypothetical protein